MRLFLFTAILALAWPLGAQGRRGGIGDLMVMPTRVILEGRDRSAEVVLRNTGAETATYRVFFQELKMLPNGEVVEVDKAQAALAASDLVRYSPRQVTLGPNETQTVRIQLRKPEGLKDGEYRSHMVFQSTPPAEPAPAAGEPGENSVSFNITTMVAISIPVIVRQGATHAAITLTGLAYHPASNPEEAPTLDLRVGRAGDRSVQGTLKVEWMPRTGRAVTVLPQAGCVIYPDIDALETRLELTETKGLAMMGGRLKVTYGFVDLKQQPVIAFLDLP